MIPPPSPRALTRVPLVTLKLILILCVVLVLVSQSPHLNQVPGAEADSANVSPSALPPDGSSFSVHSISSYLRRSLAKPRGNLGLRKKGSELRSSGTPSTSGLFLDSPPGSSGVVPGRRRLDGAVNVGVGKQPRNKWRPRADKYLLAFCLTGRLNNQLICLRNSLTLAVALNRRLLIPAWGLAVNEKDALEYWFHWQVAVDYNRMSTCLAPEYGPGAVMGTDEYLRLPHTRGRLNVSRLLCLKFPSLKCMGRAATILRKMLPQLELPSERQVLSQREIPRTLTWSEAWSELGELDDEVIAVSRMFYFQLNDHPYRFKTSPECGNLWRPHQQVMGFVDGVVESTLGPNYAAVHFRRGDFYKHFYYTLGGGKRRFKSSEFPSVVAAAEYLSSELGKRGVKSLYIASDARPIEVSLFKQVVLGTSKVTRVLTGQDIMSNRSLVSQGWAKQASEAMYEMGSAEVFPILVDKFLCVKARHFFGSARSSLSMEVQHFLRPAEGKRDDEWRLDAGG